MTLADIEAFVAANSGAMTHRDMARALGVTIGRINAARVRVVRAADRALYLGAADGRHVLEGGLSERIAWGRRGTPLQPLEVRCPMKRSASHREDCTCPERRALADATPRGRHVLDGGLSERIAWALMGAGIEWWGTISTMMDTDLTKKAGLGPRQIKRARAWK